MCSLYHNSDLIYFLSVLLLLIPCSWSVFFSDHVTIQDHHKRMIGKGEKIAGMYVLEGEKLSLLSESVFVNKVSANIWHNRLGHLSSPRLALLKSQLNCDFSDCNNGPCYICPLAKQKRLPFKSFNNLSPSPFDLIHCDIWGPFSIPSHTGHKYFLTIVDDCIRFTWLFLLKNKSDVSSIFPYFF